MNISDFDFDLPENLIAQRPSEKRGNDRLMILERKTGKILHKKMCDLPDFIESGAVMVFNDSRVRKSRCLAKRIFPNPHTKEREFLFLQDLNEKILWKTLVRPAKKIKIDEIYEFLDGTRAKIIFDDKNGKPGSEFRVLKFESQINEDWFEKNGKIPLPPYIKRQANEEDSERYQNIFAKNIGSAACPTAGLHFTKEMFSRLKNNGVEIVHTTLHVGLGTFLPVREKIIENHKMHEEFYSISKSAAQKINDAKNQGKKIFCVGTTSLRTLESSAQKDGFIHAENAKTNIFIYPGFDFKICDALFTNFHTPKSTLLMLVSAFSSREKILCAYQNAIEQKYRFFSYGDAMLIK